MDGKLHLTQRVGGGHILLTVDPLLSIQLGKLQIKLDSVELSVPGVNKRGYNNVRTSPWYADQPSCIFQEGVSIPKLV